MKLSTEEGYETNSQFFLDKKIEALVSLIFTLLLLVGVPPLFLLNFQNDLPQARLILQLIKREHSLKPTAETTEIYHTNEWFFMLLEEVILAFEGNNAEELDRVHGELHATLTPIQNRLYMLVIEGCQPLVRRVTE